MYYNRQSRLLILILIFILMFIGCAIKLINLQLVNGEEMRKVSEDKLYMSMSIKSPRGDIVDRYGKKLATSKIGYSLQIIGQKGLNPAIASLIMSLESVFSVMAGWIILKEKLSLREIAGCILIFIAVVLSQIPSNNSKNQV